MRKRLAILQQLLMRAQDLAYDIQGDLDDGSEYSYTIAELAAVLDHTISTLEDLRSD